MLQDWLKLSDAEWAVWTRAPSADVVWAFGVLAAVIVAGLALFAWGASRRRWKPVLAGLVLTVPAAMLTAVFLETAVEARGAHAWCAVEGRAAAAGRSACTGGDGEPVTLARVIPQDDGFPRIQYYWTASGLCEARVDHRCRAAASPADRVPTPGMARVGHAEPGA
ncbi:MAG: hypothetical protein ACI8U3_002409 [Brevundimonas sp.]|uniref:hypothetical protein n=1 Tax=Brevundimonas sp. TaxID=1871086 RepID=UPI0039E59BC2